MRVSKSFLGENIKNDFPQQLENFGKIDQSEQTIKLGSRSQN